MCTAAGEVRHDLPVGEQRGDARQGPIRFLLLAEAVTLPNVAHRSLRPAGVEPDAAEAFLRGGVFKLSVDEERGARIRVLVEGEHSVGAVVHGAGRYLRRWRLARWNETPSLGGLPGMRRHSCYNQRR